jgi:predicted ATPase
MGQQWVNAISRARELCRQTGKAAELCQVLGQLSIFHYVRAQYQKACEFGEEALDLARETGDPLLVTLSHWHLGFILFGLGDYLGARAHLGQVIDFYDPQEHHRAFLLLRGSDPGVSALAYDACCLWCLGYPDQAFTISREALALARRLGHTFSLVDVLCYAGCLLDKMRQDPQAIKEEAEQLVRLSTGMGSLSFGATGTCYWGDALAQLGQIQEGTAQIRAGLAARRATGEFCLFSVSLDSLAGAQALAGRPDEGLLTLAEAFTSVEQTGERIWEAELHRLKGELLLAQGDESGAEISLCKALEIARGQQAKSWELRSAVSLCRLWQKQGKQVQAGALLEGIYNWFTEGFDTPDLIAAGTLLKELSG